MYCARVCHICHIDIAYTTVYYTVEFIQYMYLCMYNLIAVIRYYEVITHSV